MKLAAAFAVLLLVAAPVAAAKPLYAGNREPMQLTSSLWVENFDVQNYGAKNGCLDEDDHADYRYDGWLPAGETFTAIPVRFCNFVTDGVSDGNTGAFLELRGDGDYAFHWWLEYTACRTVDHVCWGDYYLAVRELVPVLVQQGHPDVWRGCEADVPGTVYLTITNVGRRGADTWLDTGSQFHDTWDAFYWACP